MQFERHCSPSPLRYRDDSDFDLGVGKRPKSALFRVSSIELKAGRLKARNLGRRTIILAADLSYWLAHFQRFDPDEPGSNEMPGAAPNERPAPRWSHYIDILRDRYDLQIEIMEERHGGPFKGWHGRYVLRWPVEVLEEVQA